MRANYRRAGATLRRNVQQAALAWLVAGHVIASTATTGVPDTHAFSIGPRPAWVTDITISDDTPPPARGASDGVFYLLSDHQVRLERDTRVTYVKTVQKALNSDGVDSIARVEIEFDPAYQTLTLNSLDIRRGGHAVSRLHSARIEILQRERELEFRVLDGTRAANIFVDDVRAGDVLEYSYTLRGANPVFGNRLFGRIDLQWNVPVHRVYRRLLAPEDRKIWFKSYNNAGDAVTAMLGTEREFVWDLHDQPPKPWESSTPGWLDSTPNVQWSEFANWSEVAGWATELFALPAAVAPEIQSEVDRITQASTGAEARTRATLRFVQEQIRYLGIEIGPNTHAPAPPAVTLSRRYGDCKDKVLLMLAMLKALGVEARPALVSTDRRRGIANELPSPAAFNHVIVQARIAGTTYWLDPTRSTQEGTLANVFQPDYGLALALDKGTTGLVQMPAAPASRNLQTVRMEFDMRGGIDKPAPMTVTTVYHGSGADGMRETLASESLDKLQRDYLNFYARTYPGIAVAEPFSVSDDKAANALTIREQYRLTTGWNHNDKAKRRQLDIADSDVSSLVRRPSTPVRQWPLAVRHPVEMAFTVQALLPGDWNIKSRMDEVADPAFHFSRSVVYDQNTFRLDYHYASLADSVAPADMAGYAQHIDDARELLGYALFKADPKAPTTPAPVPPQTTSWTPLIVATLCMLIWGVYLRGTRGRTVRVMAFRAKAAPSSPPPAPGAAMG